MTYLLQIHRRPGQQVALATITAPAKLAVTSCELRVAGEKPQRQQAPPPRHAKKQKT